MQAKSPTRDLVRQAEETRWQALGRFLRERRAEIAPETVGILFRRGRRTPGLRREEVAFLADIGVKWYARLEAGVEVHPSAATLTGIAFALRLSSAELEHILELSGLQQPLASVAEVDTTITAPVAALLRNLRGVAVTVGDRILTPLRWNSLADAVFGHSRHEIPAERNNLVRSLRDPDFIALLGSEREDFTLRAVGMLRLNYWSRRPSPFVAAVHELIDDHPLFQQPWGRRIVARDLRNERSVLNHAAVGRLAVLATDLTIPACADLSVSVLSPADEETAAKFERLERMRDDYAPRPALSVAAGN